VSVLRSLGAYICLSCLYRLLEMKIMRRIEELFCQSYEVYFYFLS
jgi:hypothetical protein